jgi:hypothetical protein
VLVLDGARRELLFLGLLLLRRCGRNGLRGADELPAVDVVRVLEVVQARTNHAVDGPDEALLRTTLQNDLLEELLVLLRENLGDELADAGEIPGLGRVWDESLELDGELVPQTLHPEGVGRVLDLDAAAGH